MLLILVIFYNYFIHIIAYYSLTALLLLVLQLFVLIFCVPIIADYCLLLPIITKLLYAA